MRERIPGVSIHAFTATATPRVRRDIADQLRLEAPEILVGSFDRPNLAWSVVGAGEWRQRVTLTYRLLREVPGTAIVYAPTRRQVDATRPEATLRLGNVFLRTGALEPAVSYLREAASLTRRTLPLPAGDVRREVHGLVATDRHRQRVLELVRGVRVANVGEHSGRVNLVVEAGRPHDIRPGSPNNIERIESGLARLPESQREVLLLCCVEKLSHAEVGQVLGVAAGTVRTRLARGRAALARWIAKRRIE